MIDTSFSKPRSSFKYGKYEFQVFWFVIISLVLAGTMTVSSAEPINTKAQVVRSPLPILLEQAIATEQSSSADRVDFLGANATRIPARSLQGGT